MEEEPRFKLINRLQDLGFDVSERRGSPWDDLLDASSRPTQTVILRDLCEAVAPLRHGGQWHLVYQIRRLDGDIILLAGGPPNPNPTLAEEWAGDGWKVAAPLATLYGMHDGLGPIDGPRAIWWRDSVLPAARVAPLTRFVRFGEENILYRPADWLLVVPDGEGGGWCAPRQPHDPERARLVMWDSATHELGETADFATVLRGLSLRWVGAG